MIERQFTTEMDLSVTCNRHATFIFFPQRQSRCYLYKLPAFGSLEKTVDLLKVKVTYTICKNEDFWNSSASFTCCIEENNVKVSTSQK